MSPLGDDAGNSEAPQYCGREWGCVEASVVQGSAGDQRELVLAEPGAEPVSRPHEVGRREGVGTLPQLPGTAGASMVQGLVWVPTGGHGDAARTELSLAGPGEELELSVFEWLWESVASVLSDRMYPSGG